MDEPSNTGDASLSFYERREAELLRLAEQAFPPLSIPEQDVVRAAAWGEMADLRKYNDNYAEAWDQYVAAIAEIDERNDKLGRDEDPEPIPAELEPPTGAIIRPELVRWLLTDKEALTHVDALGVRIQAGKFDRCLNLEACYVCRPLVLGSSTLSAGVNLLGADLYTINMEGSLIRPLNDKNVDRAILADEARINGSVFLRGRCRIYGEVRLPIAKISGVLDCSRGYFRSQNGVSILADGASIGYIHFNKKCSMSGEVRLVGAQIAGSVDCSSARFQNSNGSAISLDHARIGGNIFFIENFCAHGEVRLCSSDVGRDVVCVDGNFCNSMDKSINLSNSRVRGALILRDVRTVLGEVDLTRSEIGYVVDGNIRPERILLTDCRYDAIHPGVPIDAKDRLAWLKNHDDTVAQYSENGHPLDPQPYHWLASVLRKQGYEGDANQVMRTLGWRRFYHDRENLKNHHDLRLKINLVCRRLYGIFVEHGYDRWRPLWWAFGFIVLGAVVFNDPNQTLMQPTQAYALRAWTDRASLDADADVSPDARWIEAYPAFNPWIYSADVFLPLVSFHQEDHWTPASGPFLSWNWLVKNLFLPLHIIMGWVLATLFVASFTRLMRQEQ